jgi:predicted GNAT superfamily acetyltransferase
MNVTLQTEKWSEALPELRPLFSQLWNDVAVDKDRFVAKCEEGKYKALEDSGALCLTTMRSDGALIGYYVALILPNPHYEGQGLMAYTDMFWLNPECRLANLGLRLFQFSENVWRERGVVKAYSSFKIHRSRMKMFDALGWKATDVIVSKVMA